MTAEASWFCSGFLEKESKGDNWNKRFFILDEVSLKYYKRKPSPDDPEGSQCRGEIRIKKILKVQPNTVWQGKEWCFELEMRGCPTILLVAASSVEMEDWIFSITTHPLFCSMAATRGSMDETPNRLTPSSYTTKIVGGVVIRTQHRTESVESCESSTVSPCASNTDANGQGGGVAASNSQNSITTWSPSAAQSPVRIHRKDGARVVKRGYCVKQGGRRRTWKRRFFVLDPFGLAYYQQGWDKDPIKNIPLQTLVSASECKSIQDRTNVVEVITVGRIFYMQADTDEECSAWVEAIRSVLPAKACSGEQLARAIEGTGPQSPSVGKPEGKYAQQLWRLSLGRCRDYLQANSEDSDDDDPPPSERPRAGTNPERLPSLVFTKKN